MSNFIASNKKRLNSMSDHKNTNFLSEISSFFKKNDSSNAMFCILNVIESLSLSEKRLFGRTTRYNSLYPILRVFMTLLVAPCFMVRNPYNFSNSSLAGLMKCQKDVFYGFLSEGRTNWRNILYTITVRLWSRIEIRSDHKNQETCLMIDDTDYAKTGKKIENIGRIYSHKDHKSILGFKGLFLGVTDGITQMLLDFAIVGEKGQDGMHCMSQKELDARFKSKHGDKEAVMERMGEYDKTKIELSMEMIRRAISKKLRFKYVLADSWYTCKEIIQFIHRRRIGCHYLGCIKLGEKGTTKYRYSDADYTAPALIRYLSKRKTQKNVKYSRALHCWYIQADVMFAGVACRLFFVKYSKKGKWSGLITTDRSLGFFEAYKIYAQRWGIEVIFKECKTLLGMGKCQSRGFASQIAHSAIVSLQYNILSYVKRFNAYETIGGIFRDATLESVRLTLAERIWETMIDVVIAIVRLFDITEEEVTKVVFTQSEELKNIWRTFSLKVA